MQMARLHWTKIAQLQVVFMAVFSKYKQQLQLHKVLGKVGLVMLYKQLKTKAISTWNVLIKACATVELANANVSMATVVLIAVQRVAQMLVVVTEDA
jgi:predicted NAD-dependent protein-ADP-ribosyltransferase YbiA (DUF1768 family)